MAKRQNLFLLLLLLSIHSFADVELNPAEDGVFIEDQSPLQSLKNLRSLKNLSAKSNVIQTPFVQEISNKSNIPTLFVSTQDLPIVDIQLTFNAGSAQDEQIAPGLFGLSNMVAKLMMEGTDQYSAKQIANTFNTLGAKFSVNAYRDMFIVRLRVLSDPQKLDPALELMLHVINHATFNPSGLNLVVSNTKVGQKQVLENPNRLMGIRFYRALYGHHPYAEPTVGTQGSIKKINSELLQQFRNRFLVAQNSNIALTGNLPIAQAQAISEKISQSLLQGVKAEKLIEPEDQSAFNIQFIPHQSSQAHVVMGHLAIARSDPDRVALEVANRIFGSGSFNSLLSKELRVKRGLTYNASSSLTSTQARGLFSLTYATRQDQLMESLQVAHQTLYDFIQRPITKKQLEETKEGMLRAYPMSLSGNANINAQIASIGFYDLPSDYLNLYQKQVQALTTQDVQNAIRKHLRADRLTIVVVAKEFDPTELTQILNKNLGLASQTQEDIERNKN